MEPDLKSGDFIERLEAWEREVSRYMAQSGEAISYKMQTSIVLKSLPTTLRQQVQGNASSMTSYATLRAVLIEGFLSKRAWSDSLGKPPLATPGQASGS
jgi:hypothetical protein